MKRLALGAPSTDFQGWVRKALADIERASRVPDRAADISFKPGGALASENVQDALLELDTEKQAADPALADIAALTPTDNLFIVGNGTNFVGESGATARASLGLTIGTHVQAWDADLDTIAGLAKTDGNVMVGDGAAWVVESGATLRASIGVTIGTHVQAWDADLDTLAGLGKTDGNFIVGDGAAWVVESGATARASMGVTIGTHVQAWDADLDTLAGLAKTDGNFIVGNGSAWVVESGATALTSLGISTFAQTLLDDAAAVNARATLEFATTTTDNSIVRFDSTAGKTQNHTGVTLADGGMIVGASYKTVEVTIADDAVTTISPSSYGCTNSGLILTQRGGTAQDSGLIIVAATGAFTPISRAGDVTNTNFTTGALTGTTGTDGKITWAQHSDNLLYIENRRGSTVTIRICLFPG